MGLPVPPFAADLFGPDVWNLNLQYNLNNYLFSVKVVVLLIGNATATATAALIPADPFVQSVV